MLRIPGIPTYCAVGRHSPGARVPSDRCISLHQPRTLRGAVLEMLSKDQIRILHLLPPAQNDAESPVVCEISVASRSDNPDYEALSYVWDNHAPFSLQVSGSEVKVTPGLYSALRHLRLPDRIRNLWVDQLSIEQWNLEEKAQQVQLMRSTYTRCSQCVVWLGMPPVGTSDADAKNAFDLVLYLANGMKFDDINSMPLPSAVADDRQAFDRAMEVLRAVAHKHNPWWDRVWTVQEAALPDKVVIQMGHTTLPWSTVAEACTAWIKRGIAWPLRRRLSNEYQSYWDEFIVHSIWINVAKRRWDNALETLNRWRFRSSTDPRDKAFALFGLIPPGSLPRTEECRYDIPLADVFSCMSVEMIINEKGLRPLISRPRLEAYKAIPGMPRWALDLSACADYDRDWFYEIYGYDVYNADKGLEPLDLDVVSTCVSEKTLKLKGTCIGTVKWVEEGMRRFRTGWNKDVSINEAIQKWYDTIEGKVSTEAPAVPDPYPAGYSRSEAFTRLMLGDTLRDGNQVPEDCAVEDYFADVWALMNSQTVDERVHLTVYGMMHNSALVITETGLIGSAHIDTKVGDEIWVFGGGKVPFSLQPRNSDHSVEYDFVGRCYVQGIMQGEASASNSPSRKRRDQTVIIY
ncbi:heterokaryon incompatibility protein-domain-containing protein [Nemania sp. FL0916]|nr:heterokaryon incompatibility protein-domain-containing protein [Nemania sp. FL0916]